MTVVTPTIKGQIVIPAVLRKKFGIVKGTPINIYVQNNKIILEPIHEDPVQQGRGILKTKGRVLKRLISDRKEEAKL
jgi:AbrB family looped-hinge helix DNA binding protein